MHHNRTHENALQATPVPNAVSLQRVDRVDGLIILAITNPSNDYEGFLQAPAALMFENTVCGRSCYDSDQGLIFYRSDKPVAMRVN